MMVSDSGPIIAFSRIGRLDILRRLFGQVVVPNAVHNELVVRGRGRPGSDEVTRSTWIQRRATGSLDQLGLEYTDASLEELEGLSRLHEGEREAIALAHELEVPLLIDERRGRQAALDMGVVVIGSLSILAGARREGIIKDVAPLVEAMLESGYWINPEVVDAFLAK